MPLHTRILLGLVIGAACGVAVNVGAGGEGLVETLVSRVTNPIGRIWLNALIMVVIPLVVSTLAVGVAALGDLRRVGRIGLVTIVTFLCLTTMSVTVGLVAVNLIRPGSRLDPEVRTRLIETYRGQTGAPMGLGEGPLGIDFLVRLVPANPVRAAADGEMLPVIVFALMIGVALTTLPEEKSRAMLEFLEGLGHATIAIVELVMRVAPIAVFCLIFSVTARFGFDILVSLLRYVLTVIGSLAFFFIVGYSLVLRFVAGRSPIEFFRMTRIVVLTAFSTSSSNATLPTTIRVGQQALGLAPSIAGFVIPLGATLNMNGTALFEGVTVLFIAQVFGVELSLTGQLAVVLLSVITAIGTAGIPGGSIPLLMMVLGTVGVPVEGIAIVLGVDRILDMCRTTLNVTGDLVTATVVDRFERSRLVPGATM